VERARAAVREFRQIRTKAIKHRRSVVWGCGRVVVPFSDVSCRLERPVLQDQFPMAVERQRQRSVDELPLTREMSLGQPSDPLPSRACLLEKDLSNV
jgi:hypothetical protein